MAKPRIPSQKSRYASLNQRLNKYLLLVQQIFDDLNLEAAKAATSVSYDGSKPFRFSDYPTLKKRVGDLQQRYVDDIGAVIYSGTSSEWKKSNEVQDLLADGVLKAYGAQVNGSKYKVYYQPNNDALKAFQTRRANGMTLSQKLWNQSKNYKEEMEYAISSAIEKGTSAVTLSKRLSKYFHDFPSLQKDYKEKFGKAVDCHDCEYRSMRLARSEINMAYRTAEQERWQQMDFVVGYEIKLSGSHPSEDICDMLKGKYPKYIVWNGWHPNDLCYKIPILKTEEEFWNYGEAKDKPSSKEVTDVPDAFKKWVVDNEARINAAQRRGTLPFFLKDNPLVMQERGMWKDISDMRKMAISVGGEVQGLAESIAEQFGGVVTPINYKSFGSIARKCKTEGCSPFDLKDVVRNTIIVDADKIEDVLSALESQGNVLRIKRQTPDQFMGYSGNIVNITTSNGTVAEIQVNTAKMIYAKETPAVAKSILGEDVWNKIAKETGLEGGLGHKYYEQFRVLDKMSPKALEIERLSREYYSHFQSKRSLWESTNTREVLSYIESNISYLPSQDMAKVQKWIDSDSPLSVVKPGIVDIADNVQSTLGRYQVSMYNQSSEIKVLFDELFSDSVQSGDPMQRIKLISEIKDKAAELTRSNIEKLGAVDGLQYVRVIKNHRLAEGGRYRVSKTGEWVTVPDYVLDVLEYKDPNGIRFYYPIGTNSSNIVFSASEASSMLSAMLPGQRRAVKGILFDTRPHPMDSFYRKEYENFTKAGMYSGDIISVHTKYGDALQFKRSLSHEIGHNVDGGVSLKNEWREAMRKDGNFVTEYAKNSPSEDFAETFAMVELLFTGYNRSNAITFLEQQFPNRWNILRDIFLKLTK